MEAWGDMVLRDTFYWFSIRLKINSRHISDNKNWLGVYENYTGNGVKGTNPTTHKLSKASKRTFG